MNSDDFIHRLGEIIAEPGPDTRTIVALAGPPAAGKTTLADRAVSELNSTNRGCAAALPMDGFHYDDELLIARGWRPRKGAPHTFDVFGLESILGRLRENQEESVVAPRFDRDLEIARAGAIVIDRRVSLVLVEGLYLLLDDAPWNRLAPMFDITAMIKVSQSEITRRLRQRWDHYQLDQNSIDEKLEQNDLPNGRLVYTNSRSSDWTIED